MSHLSRLSACRFQWNLFFLIHWENISVIFLYYAVLSLILKLFLRNPATVLSLILKLCLRTLQHLCETQELPYTFTSHMGKRTNVFKKRSGPGKRHRRKEHVYWQIMLPGCGMWTQGGSSQAKIALEDVTSKEETSMTPGTFIKFHCRIT